MIGVRCIYATASVGQNRPLIGLAPLAGFVHAQT